MLTRKILINATLKVARGRLLVCRFSLLWRNIVIGLFTVYMILWIFAPAFLGVYWSKSGGLLAYLSILCMPFLLTNWLFLYSKSSPIIEWGDRILEERKDFKHIIGRGKEAVYMLKQWEKEELCFFEIGELQTYLSYLDIDTEWMSMWMRKQRQAEYASEQLSLFDDTE